MSTTKKLDSIISIDNESYSVVAEEAKIAEKVRQVLTIQSNNTEVTKYDGSAAKTINIKGGGGTTVSTDNNGNITITSAGNQNVFSKIAVSGQPTVEADNNTDTLTLIAGANVTIATNATNDSITISAGASDQANKIKVTTDSGDKYATITMSINEPTGGNVGDIWFKY